MNDIRPGQLWRFDAIDGRWVVLLVFEAHDNWTEGQVVCLGQGWNRAFRASDLAPGLIRSWSLGRCEPLVTPHYRYELLS